MRIHVSKDFWLAAVRAEGAAFLEAVGEPGTLPTPVPSCPDWRVGDLVRHLGSVYRRTRDHAAMAGTPGQGDPSTSWGAVVIPTGTPDAEDPAVVAWFAHELHEVSAVLEALDADLPAWNWAPQARTLAFWNRRMAHETAVHRWDAQVATLLPEPLEGKLAIDTIAEVFDTFLPAGRRAFSADGLAGVVHLTATDLGQEWTLRLRGPGIAVLDTGTLLDDDVHPARAAASATASDLALALWGRVAWDVAEIAGDVTLLDALRVA
jgi:uncharacterized protein (TIGR03083 family)